LGIDDSRTFQENRLEGLDPGAVLLVGTDGIWETQNKKGEKFGKDRFKTIVQQHSGSTSQEMARAVITALEGFREDLKQQDDITLVIVKLNPAGHKWRAGTVPLHGRNTAMEANQNFYRPQDLARPFSCHC